jgi:Protein of unknown function (DUF616)
LQPAIVFFTCVTGGYDAWRGLDQPSADADYVYFSDRLPPGRKDGWEIRPIPEFARRRGPKAASRFVKMHPHLLFPEHAASVYVDGNVLPKTAASAYCRQIAARHALSIYRHPVRDCVYDEALECERLGLIYVGRIAGALAGYRSAGYPAHAGLMESNVLIRQHHDAQLARLMALWWREYETGVTRDQLSLPYLLWREKFPLHCLGESDPRFHNRYFDFSPLHQGTPHGRIEQVKRMNAFYRRTRPQSRALSWLMQHEPVTRFMMKLEAVRCRAGGRGAR